MSPLPLAWILMLAALFVAHDAIYLARLGAGDGYARAMSAQGHDAYWAAVFFVLSAGVALVGIATVTRRSSDWRLVLCCPPSVGGTSEPRSTAETGPSASPLCVAF